MAGDGDKKPWDGVAANDTIDDAPKRVHDASADGANQSKSFVGDSVNQVKEIFGANVDQAKELTSSARASIKRAGNQVFEGLKTVVSPFVQIFEQAESKEGTGLRKQISSVREQVNHQLHDAQVCICSFQ